MTDISLALTESEASHTNNDDISEDILPENIPLPTSTDSMITVRLSDAHLTTKDSPVEDDTTDMVPGSNYSRSCSRSSRRSSQSSTLSTSVDWEELEKTEEQEHKDDATDEVGTV